jgi:hypothetical protein
MVKFIGSSFSQRFLGGLYDFLLSTDQGGMNLTVGTIMPERRATLLVAPPAAELLKPKKGPSLLIFSLLSLHRVAENFLQMSNGCA